MAAVVSPLAIEPSVPKLDHQNRIVLPCVVASFGRHAADCHSELVRTVSEHDQLQSKRSFFAFRQRGALASPLHTVRFRRNIQTGNFVDREGFIGRIGIQEPRSGASC